MVKRALLIVSAGLLLAGCRDKQSPADTAAHVKAAQDFYAAKDYAKALVEAQAAIRGDPRNGDTHYLAAEIQEALGNQKGAFEEYARAAAPDANNLKAQLKVEEVLIEAKQFDAAIGRINATLGARPDNADALALRALAEQRRGNADKARADAQTALLRSPGQPTATIIMATDAVMAGNSDKAMAALAAGLKANPDNVALLRLKGAVLVMQNKNDEAAAIFQDLVRKNPGSANLRAGLAEIDASGNKIDAGEAVLRDGMAAGSAGREQRVALIAFLAKHRDDAAATAELQAAIKDNPTDSFYDLLLAEQQLGLKNPAGAASALEAAVARLPDGPDRARAQVALARIDAGRGDLPAARKLLDAVLASKADDDDALLTRGGLKLQSGDAAGAIPDLLAVAGRHPSATPPLQLLAEAYARHGERDKAVDALKKVAYFEPTSIAPVNSITALSLEQGKPDIAKQAIAEFVKRNPDSLEGRIAQASFALQQKDYAGAQTAIDAARRTPKSDQAVTLLSAELNEAKGAPAAAAAGYAKLIDPQKPVDRDVLAGYARSAIAAKQTDQAIATVSAVAAQRTGADAATADLVLSSLYRSAGDAAKADAALVAARTAAPTSPAAYLEAARLATDSNVDQAIAVLGSGIQAGAAAEPLLLARGDLELKAGRKDAALATYQSVLRTDPQSVLAANNYGSLVADAKPNDKARLTEAREPLMVFADTTNPALLDTMAWLDYRLGDFQTAKALLVRAKADTSKNPQLRFHYGAVLIALGDKEAGRAAIKAAMENDFPGRDEAEKMLTE